MMISSTISILSLILSCQVAFVIAQGQDQAGNEPRNLRGLRRNSHQQLNITELQFNRSHSSPVHFEDETVGSKASGRIQPRIVGGNQADFGEYPYYVDMGGCGGSLIAPDLVLTAAHCGNYNGRFITVSSYNRGQGTRVQVVDYARHPQFSQTSFQNDFALLKITPPVSINFNVQINSQRNLQDYEGLDVIGMGAQYEGGGLSSTLRDLSTRKLPTELCNRPQWYGGIVDDGSMFCAGFQKGGRDACQGDSGAPIVRKSGNQHTIVGMVSWGEGCAKARRPGVYSRVSAGYNWIWTQGCNQWGSRGGICGNGGGNPAPPQQNVGQQQQQQQRPSNYPCPANYYLFDFTIKMDGGAAGMSWVILNRNSKATVFELGNFQNWQIYRNAICIPIAPYQLLIRDSNGDGLQGGGYELRLNGGLSLSNYDNLPFRTRSVEW